MLISFVTELIKIRCGGGVGWNKLLQAVHFPFSFFLASSSGRVYPLVCVPSTVGTHWTFVQVPPPLHGRVTHFRWPHQSLLWYSPEVESPVLGTPSPQTFWLGKSGTPQVRVAWVKGHESSSLSGWPQVHVGGSGSPPSLFSGGHTPVPPQSTSGFPLLEKNPETREQARDEKVGQRTAGY